MDGYILIFKQQVTVHGCITLVLIMTVKTQFVKCTLYVLLYLTICFLLLELRKSFHRVQQSSTTTFIKINQSRQKCLSTASRIATNPANLEVKLLERDEMNGQSINLQESSAILRQVSHVCMKYKLKTPLTRRHFLYNSKHKSLYCWIRKVASTSFTKLFSDMKNRRVTHNYYKEVDALAPRSLKKLQVIVNDEKTFKFLIVRHPFQRLVSSYRDRIEDNTKHTAQAWVYVKQIFHHTRPELFRSNATTGNSHQKIFTRDKRLKMVPTFKEFLEWLLLHSKEEEKEGDDDDDDVHWDRYYTHCALCDVRYNYILKLDDYTYGQINYIFSKFGLDKSKAYLPKLEETRGGSTDFGRTCKYFATLTHDLVLKLYHRYRIDFEMYNYDLDRYMLCANRQV